MTKAKGQLPLRDVALSVRFVEDPVRQPNCDSINGPVRKLRARPSPLLRHQRRKSFITSIFPVAWRESRLRRERPALGFDYLLRSTIGLRFPLAAPDLDPDLETLLASPLS
jgi:hypothetical protein